MDKKNNPVLNFNWNDNIKEACDPPEYFLNQKPLHYLDDELPWGIFNVTYPAVQADPDDFIELKQNSETTETYHAHATVWQNSLDRYIYQYYRLRCILSSRNNTGDWQDISFSEIVMEKISKYEEKVKSGKADTPLINLDFLHFLNVNESKELGGTGYRIPQLGGALYYDYLLRSLYKSSRATVKVFSLEYDGLMYYKDEQSLHFALEDYFLHEAFSGISLTIEITAMLLEVKERYNKTTFWDNAFSAFCQKALPTIIYSPFFFTRNAVARYFFQQILMEQTVQSFQWKKDSDWNELMERAALHISILNYKPDDIDVPEEQIEDAVTHITKLLSEVVAPVNIPQYIDNPTYGLAMFCNPKHKYVSLFLDELVRQDANRTNNKIQACRHRGNPNNPYIEFERVRKEVKKAIQFVSLLQTDRQNNVKKVNIFDNIPPDIWETYVSFANAEGGTILLVRDLAKKFNKAWEPKEEYVFPDSWKLDSATIIKEFQRILNNHQSVSKNSLAEEDVQIWEFQGKEIIAITVRKQT